MAFGGSKVVEYIIRAKDATAQAVRSATGRLSGLGAGFLKQAANIKAAFEMAALGVRALWSALQGAFQIEKMTYQFKALVGGLDEARAHMAMLRELGNTPPFSLEEFAKASRSMLVMSEGVLGFRKSLELVGDAAAATGQPIEHLAHEVGRAYAVIRDGQPLARATMALRSMGAVTPEVAAELEEMQKAGASNYEIWQKLTEHLGRFNGAMKDTEETADGMVGAIQSQWSNAVRDFGAAFLDLAKGGLAKVLEFLEKLNADGTIEVWAARAVEALGKVKEVASGVADAVSWVWEKAGISDIYHHVAGAVADVAAMAGAAAGSIDSGAGLGQTLKNMVVEGGKAYTAESVKGHYTNMMARKGKLGDAYTLEVEAEEAKAAALEGYRASTVDKKAREKAAAEADAERKAAEEEARIEEEMAKAQAAQKAKAEEEAAKKAAEAERKEQEKLAREQERILEQLERERERLAEKAYQKEVKLAQDAVAESSRAESNARSRLEAANQKVAQAWTWYRDKDAMQAHIDDVLEQRAAEKQWEKDFKRLQSRFRGDTWKNVDIGKLSAEEEAVRQVALAKEEQAAAQKALDEIAENTRGLAEKLDELLTAKEG